MRIAGYIRVSTDDQRKHGWTLDEDRVLIAERCPEGAELELFDDGGLQGDDPNRPALLALLSRLDEFDLVIMRQQDRISRDPIIWGTCAAAFQKAKIRVETFTGPIDLDTPQGRFFADMMAAVGKLEKGQIAQRVKQAMQGRARAGRHNGGPRPYGYLWDPYQENGKEKHRLVIFEAEKVIVRRIFAEFLAGTSQRQIARNLMADGIAAQRGGTWHQGTITKYLANPIYKGAVRLNGQVYDGEHEAIIDPETWDKARQLREAMRKSDGGGYGRTPTGSHLFTKGMLRCGLCGEAMIPRTSPTRTPGRLYEAYLCYGRMRHGTDFCPQTPVRRELIDDAVFRFYSRVAFDRKATEEAMVDSLQAKLAEVDAVREEAETTLARAEARLARVRRDYQDGKLDADDWREQRLELTAEIEAGQAILAEREAHRLMASVAIEEIDAEAATLRELADLAAMIHGQAHEGSQRNLDAFRAELRRLFVSFDLKTGSGFSFDPPPKGAVVWTGEADDLLIEHEGQPMFVKPHPRADAITWDDPTQFPALNRSSLALSVNNSNPLIM